MEKTYYLHALTFQVNTTNADGIVTTIGTIGIHQGAPGG